MLKSFSWKVYGQRWLKLFIRRSIFFLRSELFYWFKHSFILLSIFNNSSVHRRYYINWELYISWKRRRTGCAYNLWRERGISAFLLWMIVKFLWGVVVTFFYLIVVIFLKGYRIRSNNRGEGITLADGPFLENGYVRRKRWVLAKN